ncbi:hypothetical protein LEP1GSC052_3072 [Leptospira kmetyi serovar Malaysia str. Bejo-Iso9]|nr:hypothetical protein LEP1GSC052_3072 [Leptospira kmetyi serovar Malaysia str. Bejo-Iso9]
MKHRGCDSFCFDRFFFENHISIMDIFRSDSSLFYKTKPDSSQNSRTNGSQNWNYF